MKTLVNVLLGFIFLSLIGINIAAGQGNSQKSEHPLVHISIKDTLTFMETSIEINRPRYSGDNYHQMDYLTASRDIRPIYFGEMKIIRAIVNNPALDIELINAEAESLGLKLIEDHCVKAKIALQPGEHAFQIL